MTLESQYKQFLQYNSESEVSFEQWKQWHGDQIKQALTDMMKDDEELGLYDEPFKHKVEVLSKEEILANRSNAYEFIDFDKQETLNEIALEFAKDHHEMYETNNLGAMHFGFCWGAKWQQERMYNEEDMIEFSKFMLLGNHEYKSYQEIFNEWFEQFKKK